MTDTPDDSLLSRHLRGLIGCAVTLNLDEERPIGRLIEADGGHALIETPEGDRWLVSLDGLEGAESGPSHEASFARKLRLHETFGERIDRAKDTAEERLVRKSLADIERDDVPRPAISDPEGFLRRLVNDDPEDDR